MPDSIAEKLNEHLAESRVLVKFLDLVLEKDLPRYNKGQLTEIFAAIIKRFEGNGNPHKVTDEWILRDDLRGYFKIRLLPQMIRVVYKFDECEDCTIVTIVVVGPKKREEAYKIAKKRISQFFK